MNNRRTFLKTLPLGLVAAGCSSSAIGNPTGDIENNYAKLDAVLTKPVLKKALFSSAVMIASMELLKYKDNYICCVRSTDGAEGISVSNNAQMQHFYPVFMNRIAPFFPGKDARLLEDLLEEIYVYRDCSFIKLFLG